MRVDQAMLVRAYLYAGKTADARIALDEGSRKHPQSFELLLAQGRRAGIIDAPPPGVPVFVEMP